MNQFVATALLVVSTLGSGLAQEPAKPAGAKPTEAKPVAAKPVEAKPEGSVAQSLMDMENQWAKLSKASDADALAPMLSEDFVALDSDGTLHTKTELLARTKKAKWTTCEVADLKVIVHGDAAIVTGSWTGKGTDASGKAVDSKERWADTWVKTSNGKWQCVASASAPTK